MPSISYRLKHGRVTQSTSRTAAFTLVEVMIVVAIIGL
ncbi:MAG: hypothetical protein DRP64_14560, partial [Verrucomicrobia bacterium]